MNSFKIQKLYLYSILILVFLIPIKIKIVPLFIGLSTLLLLIQKDFYLSLKDKLTNKYFLVSISIFIIYFLGSLYSDIENFKRTSFDLQVKLSFLLFPIIFIDNGILRKNRLKIFKVFILGVFIASIICLVFAFHNSLYKIDDIWYFNSSYFNSLKNQSFLYLFRERVSYFSSNILTRIVHHHSYFGLYLLTSIVFLFDILMSRNKTSLREKVIYIFLIVYFIIFIIMAQSRANYIAFIAILIFYGGIYMYKRRNAIIKIFIPILIVLIILLLGKHTSLYRNFNTDIVTNFEKAKKENLRLALWEASLNVIKEKPLFGVGNGDVRMELEKTYIKKDVLIVGKKYLNSHNQFLETTVGLGVFGLLFLILWFLFPIFQAMKRRDIVMISFLIIVGINLLFESMFNRIAGVVFIAFFYNFLISFYAEESV